jgi:L-alanine-DL-glutamate epimerase-like enolase superfamily enzyme
VEPMPCGLDTRRLLDDDIVRGPLVEGSRLRLPAGPGLGVELDRRALDLYRLDR